MTSASEMRPQRTDPAGESPAGRRVRIHVDGVAYEALEGLTVLQALDDLGVLGHGVDVPHYCWHPKLETDGSCRMCQIEVDGETGLQVACDTPVREGMDVTTQSERVRRARRGVMELLLVNHPLDCPICDQAGECRLQDYAVAFGSPHARTREPRRELDKRRELGETVLLDQERCILCRRCVRFCREITGTGELGILARGDRSVVDVAPGEPLDNAYSMNVADLCPVGALTTRDFRFKARVWSLTSVPGVCTGCARGCNVTIDVEKDAVQRYVPRRNDEVNDTWICDVGRLSYRRIGATDRLSAVRVRQPDGALGEASFDDAIARAARAIREAVRDKGPGVVAMLASPHATNEDLFVLRRLVDGLGVASAGAFVPQGDRDELLVLPEKAANAVGARALGFGDGAPVLDRVRGGGVDVLLVLGHELAAAIEGDANGLAGLDALILLDTHASALERAATVVFPTLHAAEKHGSLTNHAGRAQRVVPAVGPPAHARADGEVLFALGRALRLPGFAGGFDPDGIARELAAAVPGFAGLDLDALGDAGLALPLAGRESA